MGFSWSFPIFISILFIAPLTKEVLSRRNWMILVFQCRVSANYMHNKYVEIINLIKLANLSNMLLDTNWQMEYFMGYLMQGCMMAKMQ